MAAIFTLLPSLTEGLTNRGDHLCCVRFPLVYMLSPLPRHSDWGHCLAHSPSPISLPRNGGQVGLCNVLFEDCSAFTRVTACTLAGSPKAIRYIEGFRVSERVTPLAPHRPHRAELPQRVPQGDSLG